MSERKRIAVVGSGVAGLSAAYLLAREHDVTIFEREAAVGMDAHSLDAHGARMDIPLRVFSESYYPNLCSLYRRIGVKYRAADYSFSCLGGHAGAAAYFRYINFFVRGMALPLPMCLNPLQVLKCVRLAAQFAHFVNMSPSKLAATTAEPSLDAFLKAEGYSEEFATQVLRELGRPSGRLLSWTPARLLAVPTRLHPLLLRDASVCRPLPSPLASRLSPLASRLSPLASLASRLSPLASRLSAHVSSAPGL